jgi:2-iminobutanoate/2-iminopropanoate deaminase
MSSHWCQKAGQGSIDHRGAAMIERVTPEAIHPPLANYRHAVCVPPGARWLFLSGQLGIAPDGTIPQSFEGQAAQCFENIRAILAGAGMGFSDLVRLNTYLTDPADLKAYMAVRDRYVGDPPPASTLLVIQALARPELRIEVEAVAAQAGSHRT